MGLFLYSIIEALYMGGATSPASPAMAGPIFSVANL